MTGDGDGGRGRHDHLRHRLQRHRHAGRPATSAAAAAARSTEHWQGSPQATWARRSPASRTCSCCSAPTPGLGHSSMVYMIESQVAYVIERAAARCAAAAPRPPRSGPRPGATSTTPSTARMADTVWSTGCSSWYLDETGRNATLWPDWTFALPPPRRALRRRPRTSSAPAAARASAV